MIGLKEIFPEISLEQWLEKLKKDLKSEDLHELNFVDELEGLTYKSFSHQDLIKTPNLSPGQFPYTRGLKAQNNDWKNGFSISVTNAHDDNKKALEVLMKGVDSLHFDLGNQPVDFEVLLKDIGLEHIHTTFYPKTIEQLKGIINGPIKSAKSHVSISVDLHENNELSEQSKTLIDFVRNEQFPLFLADGFKIQQCGGSITQELSFILSSAHEYLILLQNEGLTIDEAAGCIHFRTGIGASYFQEIAKIRALRLLWANIVRQYQPKHACSYNCRITAQTGFLNKSAKDPHTNLLRLTTEAMSAISGGIEELVVLPHNAVSKNGVDSLSERMAINISLILKEESYLHAVIDPTGGSYTIEDLTNQISDVTWSLFQEMDAKGGIFNEDYRQEFIKKVQGKAEQRLNQFRNKEKTLIGVNKFQNSVPEDNSFGELGSYLGLRMINLERDI